MRVKPVTDRKLYFILVAALFLLWLLWIINEEIYRIGFLSPSWLGLIGGLLLMGLLTIIFLDKNLARQMIWPVAPFQPYHLGERTIVVAVRVACLVGLGLTVVLVWPTARQILNDLWRK